MKKFLLKLRILFTNICRVITSFLFVNLIISSKGIAVNEPIIIETTCYAVGPPVNTSKTGHEVNIFAILVPVVIVVAGIVIFVIHMKKRKNKKEDNLTEDTDNDK